MNTLSEIFQLAMTHPAISLGVAFTVVTYVIMTIENWSNRKQTEAYSIVLCLFCLVIVGILCHGSLSQLINFLAGLLTSFAIIGIVLGIFGWTR